MCHISEVTCLRLNLYVRVVTTTALTPYRIFTEPQQGATYDDLLTVALRAESLGFGAFFRSDHYLKMGSVSGDPGPSDAWVTLGGLARDTTTRGTSLLEAVEVVRAFGASVVLASVIVDRGTTCADLCAAEGVEYRPLLTATDLGFDPGT